MKVVETIFSISHESRIPQISLTTARESELGLVYLKFSCSNFNIGWIRSFLYHTNDLVQWPIWLCNFFFGKGVIDLALFIFHNLKYAFFWKYLGIIMNSPLSKIFPH